MEGEGGGPGRAGRWGAGASRCRRRCQRVRALHPRRAPAGRVPGPFPGAPLPHKRGGAGRGSRRPSAHLGSGSELGGSACNVFVGVERCCSAWRRADLRRQQPSHCRRPYLVVRAACTPSPGRQVWSGAPPMPHRLNNHARTVSTRAAFPCNTCCMRPEACLERPWLLATMLQQLQIAWTRGERPCKRRSRSPSCGAATPALAAPPCASLPVQWQWRPSTTLLPAPPPNAAFAAACGSAAGTRQGSMGLPARRRSPLSDLALLGEHRFAPGRSLPWAHSAKVGEPSCAWSRCCC